MSDNLTVYDGDKRVFAVYNKDGINDAWHRLGQVYSQPISATDAWAGFGNPYKVEKVQMQYLDFKDSKFYGIRKIDRFGLLEDEFGIVGEGYVLVTPEDFCWAWDKAGSDWPIETIGALGNGSRMFVLSRMPDVEIADEEHQQYILGVNDMTGKGSQILKITDVRVVCANTLNIALKDMTSAFKVDHDSQVVENMRGWINDVLSTVHDKSEAVKQALEIMAQTRITDDLFDTMLQKTITVSKPPKKTGSPMYDSRLVEQWETKNSVAIARRGVITGLYNGDMKGYDNPLVRGTAYGAYCAVTEATDHVIPGRGEDNLTYVQGWRDSAKDNAFKFLIDVSKN